MNNKSSSMGSTSVNTCEVHILAQPDQMKNTKQDYGKDSA